MHKRTTVGVIVPGGPDRESGGGVDAGPSILLVDDHPLWRESLRRVLELRSGGTVVGEASDGDEALDLAARLRPDVVIMDVDLPTIDGVEATRRLRAAHPDARVLFLSASQAKDDVVAAVRAGASAYLIKTAGSAEVIDAVRRVHDGELVFPPALAAIVLDQLRDQAVGVRIKERRRAPVATDNKNRFILEGEFWTLSFESQTVRLKDSKGLRYIAALLASANRGVHALELVASNEWIEPSVAVRSASIEGLRLDDGAPGEILDPAARAAYRTRLEELREQIEEAEEWQDTERASQARAEMEIVAGELARAVGLGGRGRKTSSATERARVNVTRAIAAAVKRMNAVHPSLGRHLSRSIRTGTFCTYEPGEVIAWTL